jgi:hypothetical protein
MPTMQCKTKNKDKWCENHLQSSDLSIMNSVMLMVKLAIEFLHPVTIHGAKWKLDCKDKVWSSASTW